MAKKSSWKANRGTATPVVAINPKTGKAKKAFKRVTDAAQWLINQGLSSTYQPQNLTGRISAATRTGATAYGFNWSRS